jgi:hypothetical protein
MRRTLDPHDTYCIHMLLTDSGENRPHYIAGPPTLRSVTRLHTDLATLQSNVTSHHLIDQRVNSTVIRQSVNMAQPPAPLGTVTNIVKHNAARTYAANELLDMREKLPFVVCDLKKLNPDVVHGISPCSIFVTWHADTAISRCYKSQHENAP